MSKVKISQVRSSIDRPKDQKETLVALGLGRIGKSRELELTPSIQGMIKKVAHLISVS
jgi:large subunit ribosomal protein L30